MPYIKKIRRGGLDPLIEALQQRLRVNGCERGDVNYVVTRIALGVLASVPGYKNYSDAIAALQDAADEIKRRCLSRYEDFSEDTNGDVVEFVEADRIIDGRWDDLVKPLSNPATVDVTVKPDGRCYDNMQPIVDSPISQVAAEQYQKLQSEIKEAFDRR